MKKNAQAIGQIFIYIVAALTFALVTLFGYKAVESFLEKSEQVALVSFKNELENTFQRVAVDYGAVRIGSFTTAVDYTSICFVDVEESPPNPCEFNIIACDLWGDVSSLQQDKRYANAIQNVFLSPHAEVPIKVARLTTRYENYQENYLCIPIYNGNFRVRLEGLGDRVIVSRAVEPEES
jgi:hypothetical protein